MKYGIIGTIAAMVCISLVFAATETIRPDAQGNFKGWAVTGCSGGSSEYTCVDEVSLDTSDYVRTSGTQKETFTFSNVALSNETINSVTLYYVGMEHNSASNRCIEAMTRSGGTNYFAGSQLCFGTNWSTMSQVFSTNPATSSAWTVSEVNSLEAGMRGKNPQDGGRVAQVYAVVDYDAFVCGNNVTEGNETCDGSDLNGETCISQGFSGGTLGCQAGCGGFDTSGCFLNTCSDTDNGINISFQGTVSGSINLTGFNHTDSCSDNVTLVEWYCSGTTPFNLSHDCTLNGTGTACSAGACV